MYVYALPLVKNISANIVLDMIDKANEDDPNEISFEKNEVLEVLDKGGKWWQVKRQDGTIGSAS
jgi:hypothetical protein